MKNIFKYIVNTVIFLVFWALLFLPSMKYSLDYEAMSIAAIGGVVGIFISYRLVKRINKSNLWSKLFDKNNESEKKVEVNNVNDNDKKNKKSISLDKIGFAVIVLVLVIIGFSSLNQKKSPIEITEESKNDTNIEILDMQRKYFIDDSIDSLLNTDCSYATGFFKYNLPNLISPSYENEIKYNESCNQYSFFQRDSDNIDIILNKLNSHLNLVNNFIEKDNSNAIPYFIKGLIYFNFYTIDKLDKRYKIHEINNHYLHNSLFALNKAIDLEDDNEVFYFFRAKIYSRLGNNSKGSEKEQNIRYRYYNSAISDLKSAINLTNHYELIYFEELSSAYIMINESKSAIYYLSKKIESLEKQQLTPHYLDYLNRIYYCDGKAKQILNDVCGDISKAYDIYEKYSDGRREFFSTWSYMIEEYLSDC